MVFTILFAFKRTQFLPNLNNGYGNNYFIQLMYALILAVYKNIK